MRLKLFLIGALLWGVVFSWVFDKVRIGIDFEPGTVGDVVLVEVAKDGVETCQVAESIMPDGKVAFSSSLYSRAFYFKIRLSGDNGQSMVVMRGIRFFGIPALSADQIANFNLRGCEVVRLKSGESKSVVLKMAAGGVFDLPNVFPFLHHVGVMVGCAMAWGPLAALVLFMIGRMVGRRMVPHIARWFDRPMVFGGFLAVVLLLTLPPPVSPVVSGLDPSWIWCFNHFAFSGEIGRSFVFTYGPLGFLISPQCTLANVVWGIAINLCFAGVLAWMLVILYRQGWAKGGRIAALALLMLWGLRWTNGMEWKWGMVSVTATLMALRFDFRQRDRFLLIGLAAVLGTLQCFVKLSCVVSVLLPQMFLVAVFMVCGGRRSFRLPLCYGMVLLVSLSLGFLVLFPGVSEAMSWIRGSREIVLGYNLYMGDDKSVPELLTTFGFMMAFMALMLAGKVDWKKNLGYWALLSPLWFCLYRYAMVRNHVIPFALVAAWFAALELALLPSRKWQIASMVVSGVLAAWFTEVVWLHRVPGVTLSPSNLVASCSPASALDGAKTEAKEGLKAAALPESWYVRIGTNCVMIAGWEMGPAMDGRLDLVPFPATQTYSAYTAMLDELCAKSIEADTAPRFLLVPSNPLTFDARNIYFDNPRLWNTVRRWYVHVDSGTEHVLLERREHPLPSVPGTSVFSLQRTLAGRLESFALRASSVKARVYFRDGTEVTCAANVEVLDGTPLPEVLPVKIGDVPGYFGASVSSAKPIRRIEILPAHDYVLAGKRDYAIKTDSSGH